MSIRTMLCRIALLMIAAVAPALAAPPAGLPITHMYVLGDSLSDQGNLLFATTDLGPPVIPSTQFYANGRFSNGETYAGALAARLGVHLAPSELGGTNFAFGGARTDYNRVEFRPGVPAPINGFFPEGAYPWSLEDQIAEFALRAQSGQIDPDNALFVVFSGSNDLSDALFYLSIGAPVDPVAMVTRAVQGVVHAVLAFKAAGAKTILVPLMPNLGLIPALNSTPLGPAATGFSALFNSLLVPALAAIDPNIVKFDTFTALTTIVQNPAAFGFENVTGQCFSGSVEMPVGTVCPDPDKYAFWDREHPTAKLHAILANMLYETELGCAPRANGRSFCAVNTH
jgi:phospholipase/lecithinase/hemolysin